MFSEIVINSKLDKKLYAILIIDSDVSKEPRVLKTIEALHNLNVTPVIFSYTESFKGCICFKLPRKVNNNYRGHLKFNPVIRKLFSASLRLKNSISGKANNQFFLQDKALGNKILNDIGEYSDNSIMVICHHLNNLPVAHTVADKLKVDLIFNAHEYYPEQFVETLGWIHQQKRLIAIADKYLKKCYKIFTVCNGILKRYEKEFSLKKDQQILVTNAVKYKELTPSATDSKIRFVHQGIANRNRKLELMIQVADHVDNNKFEFYFILMPSGYDVGYFNYLKEEIEKRPNCFLLDMVPTEKISEFINRFDMGFYMYDNSSNFNMIHYLPNKLYEFIQARCGVVIGPYTEMKTIVTDYKIGVVAKENSVMAIAKAIEGLTTDQVKEFKNNSNQAAIELKGENEIKKMREVFEKIVSKQYEKTP